MKHFNEDLDEPRAHPEDTLDQIHLQLASGVRPARSVQFYFPAADQRSPQTRYFSRTKPQITHLGLVTPDKGVSTTPILHQELHISRRGPTAAPPLPPISSSLTREQLQSDTSPVGSSSAITSPIDPSSFDVAATAERVSRSTVIVQATTQRSSQTVTGHIISVSGALLISLFIASYKTESTAIGFCDVGLATNRVLESRRAIAESQAECSRILSEAYREDNFETDWDCSPLPLIPLPAPKSCTPCPENAIVCSPNAVTCAAGYSLRLHPATWLLSTWLDGLPGFGPIAYPPFCAIDLDWEGKVDKVARQLDEHLSQLRNSLPCQSNIPPSSYSINKSELYWFAFRNSHKVRRSSILLRNAVQLRHLLQLHLVSLEQWDDIFRQALNSLVSRQIVTEVFLPGEEEDLPEYVLFRFYSELAAHMSKYRGICVHT